MPSGTAPMALRCAVIVLSTYNAVALRAAPLRRPAVSSMHTNVREMRRIASRRGGITVRHSTPTPLVGKTGSGDADDEKIYAAVPAPPSGLFGARPDAYFALEIPVEEEVRGQVAADDVEEPEGSSFGLDLEVRKPGGFAPVLESATQTQSKDWLHCIATWPRSYVLWRISNPLAAIVVWSSLVAAWYSVFNPVAKPLGTGMHTLVGGALSLLLVFRTNTAYNRFWAGRSIFGSVAMAARDIVARSSNMPLAITSKIAQEIKSVSYAPDDSYTVRERLYLLKRVADLRSTIARAERIVQMPVPLHYARHTSRFLSVWCFTLPLCLAPTVPAVVLPIVVGLASWALLGLREIGLLIENPFRRSLQLTQCTDALGREIDETLALRR